MAVSAGGLLQPVENRPGGGVPVLLPQVIRAVPVHAHLSHEGDQAGFLQQVHQDLRGGKVQGGEEAGPGGGAFPQVVHKEGVGLSGVLRVGVPRLLGEGAGVQPLQQLQIHLEAAEGVLGGVNVEVRQPRHYQLSGIVLQGNSLIALGEAVKDPGRPPVLADQVSVRHDGQVIFIFAVADISFYHSCCISVQM